MRKLPAKKTPKAPGGAKSAKQPSSARVARTAESLAVPELAVIKSPTVDEITAFEAKFIAAYPDIFAIRLNQLTKRSHVLQTQRRPGQTALRYSLEEFATSTHAQIALDGGGLRFGGWAIFQE